ncbi:glutamine-hydrolyzing GMP synthase [Patescibacteria group bacterium]|nr:glutamine-hydrolyzing GMP synthase [Patescibacteria group bacterium]MBU1256684.1 glutamine-hydrolyzing GMP synthase [Patescibacteria group bacterium]MBU1457158.1 glutamine-hydrolyzing GMP synthase [Patescibacteria group bacterium]
MKKLQVQSVIDSVKKIMAGDKKSRVISAVSGGVDSTVVSAIVAKAIGNRLIPVHIDNGLMRLGTAEEVKYIFESVLGIKLVVVRARENFLQVLKGVTSPEEKRKKIGKLYIDLFEKIAKKHGDVKYLVQGTIYPDIIESYGSKHAGKIKSHHNVGGLPKNMNLKLLEPLRDYYKEEVKELGRQMNLSESILTRQPLPGPGQAIRIIGEVTQKRLAKQQQSDQIVIEVLKDAGWYNKIFQSFPILTGIKSTAIKDNKRIYNEVLGLRICNSKDAMMAGWTQLPYKILQKISTRITNEVPGISRVVYDITTKPPATIEWE